MNLSLDWAYAYGPPAATAVIRHSPEDFFVDEILGFEPSGDGQHYMLQIEKRNTNTEWLARQLARLADVRPLDVGYSGLKDRNAVTRQWFSIDLAGREEPDWSMLESSEITILQSHPHRRKLRRGTHRGNRFRLMLRNIAGDRADIERRLGQIAKQGVPNYFGNQRFGHEAGNLVMAAGLFDGSIKVKNRHKRGLYLSASRAYLFNAVVSRRVAMDNWARAVDGDVFVLDGRRGFFTVEDIDDVINHRVTTGEIHPSAPLWGKGECNSTGAARQIELDALQGREAWQVGLEKSGLELQRRAVRVMVNELQWQWFSHDELQLQFVLTSGAYATSVLRELVMTGE
jgi:tRNA pseudouridine13 synthase